MSLWMLIRTGYSPTLTEKVAKPEFLSRIGAMSENTAPPPWRAAITAAIEAAGGKTALMRVLNERGWAINSHNVISQWVENGVPPKYCPDLEDLTGIPCESLCPDVKWGLVRDRRGTPRPAKTDEKQGAH
jgi:DNA-binding transcriptional regulator YdaS (Cro superfamily)